MIDHQSVSLEALHDNVKCLQQRCQQQQTNVNTRSSRQLRWAKNIIPSLQLSQHGTIMKILFKQTHPTSITPIRLQNKSKQHWTYPLLVKNEICQYYPFFGSNAVSLSYQSTPKSSPQRVPMGCYVIAIRKTFYHYISFEQTQNHSSWMLKFLH